MLSNSVTLRKEEAGMELGERPEPGAGTAAVVMVGVPSQIDKEPKPAKGKHKGKYD